MMDTSSEINEIAKALAKAQGDFDAVPKDANNSFFKSKYATQPSVVKVAAPILKANGLAVVQTIGFFADDETMTTRLLHESGQWIEDTMRLHLTKKDSQGLGSAITYARRYAYMSILGLVADEDDDGNAASNQQTTPPRATATTKRAAPKVDADPKPQDEVRGPNLSGLFAIKGRSGESIVPTEDDDRHKWATTILGRDVESFKDLTQDDVDALKKAAKKQALETPAPARSYADEEDSERPF